MTTPSDVPTSLLPERTVQAEFTGKMGEYTKLWLVNLFLSIVTLGIYSAWAKVRNTQYLYGHTAVDKHRLQYLATPMQILKGRAIAAGVFVLYSLVSSINPVLSIFLSLLFLFAFPWLMVQGIRFSMRMTSYRNVRFSFTGTYGGIVKNFLLLPLIAALTLYLALPWALRHMQKYVYDNITYGGKPFELKSSTGEYYIAALAAVGVALVGFAIAATITGTGAALLDESTAGSPVLFFLVAYGTFFIAQAFYQSIIHNHIVNSLELEGVASFNSSVKLLPYTWLLVSNALLIVLSVGLLFPVTQIRKRAYLASVTQVNIQPGLEKMVNTIDGQDGSLGEEAAGMFDVDFSLT